MFPIVSYNVVPLHSLEVSVPVFSVGLQHHGDDGHERLHHAELQRGLLAEAQEADGVGLPPQAAGAVHAAGPEHTAAAVSSVQVVWLLWDDGEGQDLLDGFASDLGHDGALSSQVFIAQAEEVVDHKRCGEIRGDRSGLYADVTPL